MDTALSVNNLSKIYTNGENSLTVLKDLSFDVGVGESLAIVGPSGSGKTTLLGLCAGLDKASTGEVWIFNETLEGKTEDQLAELRNLNIGFIFQNFQLLPTLTALENVMIPLELQGHNKAAEVARKLLGRVGLAERLNHYPSQLSGGEQQRVSIARAFSNDPKILFADEPTGNLDEETGASIENLLFDLNKELKTTLIIVTHDMDLARKTQRIIKLRGGRLQEVISNY